MLADSGASGWSLPSDAWLTGSGSTAIDATAAPSSALDVAASGATTPSAWDQVSGGLSGLLNSYTQIETAKALASGLPMPNQPGQYMRVPGTGQVVPAGTTPGSGSAAAGGISMTMLLIIGAVIYFATQKG